MSSVLLDMRLEGEIGQVEFGVVKQKLLEERVALKEKLDDENESSLDWLERAESFFETAFSARTVFDKGNIEQKRSLVKAVGWNLVLRDKKLDFRFRKPFDVLLEPSMRENVQACQDLNLEESFWRAS